MLSSQKTYYLFAALLSACFAIFIAPGWVFHDSAHQWEWAAKIANQGLRHDLREYVVTTHWPFFNTVWKWAWLKAGLTPAFFAGVQAVVLSVVFLQLLFRGAPQKTVLVSGVLGLLTMAHPVFRNYAVFHSSDTVTAILLVVISIFIGKTDLGRMSGPQASALLGITWLVGLFRFNTSLSVFLGAAVLMSQKHQRRAGATLFLAASLSVLTSHMLLRPFVVYHAPVYAEGIGVKNLVFYSQTKDAGLRKSLEGFVKVIDGPIDPECYGGLRCESYMPGNTFELTEAKSELLLKSHFKFMARHPFDWVRLSLPFWSRTYGLSLPLLDRELGREDVVAFDSMIRMEFNSARRDERARLWAGTSFLFSILKRPFFLFLLAGLSFFLMRQFISSYRRERARQDLICLICANLYYFPFLGVGLDTDLRYFFPSMVLLFAIWVRQAVWLIK